MQMYYPHWGKNWGTGVWKLEGNISAQSPAYNGQSCQRLAKMAWTIVTEKSKHGQNKGPQRKPEAGPQWEAEEEKNILTSQRHLPVGKEWSHSIINTTNETLNITGNAIITSFAQEEISRSETHPWRNILETPMGQWSRITKAGPHRGHLHMGFVPHTAAALEEWTRVHFNQAATCQEPNMLANAELWGKSTANSVCDTILDMDIFFGKLTGYLPKTLVTGKQFVSSVPKKHAEWNDKENQCDEKIHPIVNNLSSISLSPAQISLLCKGLKFTPTPSPDLTGLSNDIKATARKLRLRE